MSTATKPNRRTLVFTRSELTSNSPSFSNDSTHIGPDNLNRRLRTILCLSRYAGVRPAFAESSSIVSAGKGEATGSTGPFLSIDVKTEPSGRYQVTMRISGYFE